jgi:hypothetical protein
VLNARVKHLVTRSMVRWMCISRNGSEKATWSPDRLDQVFALLGLYKIKKSTVRGHAPHRLCSASAHTMTLPKSLTAPLESGYRRTVVSE